MFSTMYFEHKLSQAFESTQAKLLAETIVEAYEGLVKSEDFNELKSIVRELAEAQKELTVAQQRTEQTSTRQLMLINYYIVSQSDPLL